MNEPGSSEIAISMMNKPNSFSILHQKGMPAIENVSPCRLLLRQKKTPDFRRAFSSSGGETIII